MVRAFYAFLGRLAYWLTSPLLFLVSMTAQPRVRVIIVDNEGRVLLVRNWFGRQRWALPGGGVKRHEPPVKAALRELREEVSLDLGEDELSPLGSIEKYDPSTPFAVTIFSAELPAETVVYRHPLEIIETCWVHPDELPEPVHPSVERALKLWRP